MPNLLRLIDRHTDLDFVRTKRKDFQSDTGRPSIDPELLLRILLVGYLYASPASAKWWKELRMHLRCGPAHRYESGISG
jgi:transposase